MVLCPFNKGQRHRGVKNLTRSYISNEGTPVYLILEPDLLTTQFSQDASDEFGGKKANKISHFSSSVGYT